MQLTDSQSDAETPRRFISPDERGYGFKLVEDPPLVRGDPRIIPYWFVATIVLIILSVFVWQLSINISDIVRDKESIAFFAVGIIIFSLALPSLFFIIYLLNRGFKSRGPFFILDTVESTLTLPRSRITVRQSDIVEFVQLTGWYKTTRVHQRLHELIAVIDDGEGERTYYSVAVDDLKSRVNRAGRRLSEFFAVPLRIEEV